MQTGKYVLLHHLRDGFGPRRLIDLIKLGEEGAIIHTDSPKNGSAWQTDKIEALNGLPQDPAGAGDAMLTTAALSLVCGASIWLSAYLASVSAAIQVSRMGNVPITSNDLLIELKK
jgi:sugar/nucleoside kinase (ribokinase family)